MVRTTKQGFVYQNINENITLQMLADTVHFNPNYFVSFFKKQYKITPIKFVQLIRLEKAKDLILKTDLSIHEIAYKTGFSDAAHLSKTFKKELGYTPIEYRKLN
ncbi:MAG: helix-turn-helix transcriptional regulator [Clostridia bacterium]|jgi:AraC family transcriptional regulator of arabinose operon